MAIPRSETDGRMDGRADLPGVDSWNGVASRRSLAINGKPDKADLLATCYSSISRDGDSIQISADGGAGERIHIGRDRRFHPIWRTFSPSDCVEFFAVGQAC